VGINSTSKRDKKRATGKVKNFLQPFSIQWQEEFPFLLNQIPLNSSIHCDGNNIYLVI
jgi:hypothetical protein